MRLTETCGTSPILRALKRAMCALMALTLIVALMPAPAAQAAGRSLIVKKKTYMRKKKAANSKALRTLNKGTRIALISKSGAWYKVKYGAQVGYVLSSKVSVYVRKPAKKPPKKPVKPPKKPPKKPPTISGSAVIMASWNNASTRNLVRSGKVVLITDVYSGRTFKARCVNGHLHMDMEPATAADTATLKRIYGGGWSWNRRPIWIHAKGNRYAASMNGMPHGKGTGKANGYDGVFCVHFKDSRTHGTKKIDPLHQKAVRIAYNRGQK